MNNQWRGGADAMVVWADETYDRSRKCDSCGSSTCSQPVHTDRYKEIGLSALELDESQLVSESVYWTWMQNEQPLGAKTDFDGDKIAYEFFTSNPDGLEEAVDRTSGTNKQQHEWMQEAYNQLTEQQKQIWDLIQREQMRAADVAEKLGVSKPAVTQMLNRAKIVVTNYLRSKQERGFS